MSTPLRRCRAPSHVEQGDYASFPADLSNVRDAWSWPRKRRPIPAAAARLIRRDPSHFKASMPKLAVPAQRSQNFAC